MSVLGVLAEVGEVLIENAPLFKTIGEALGAGHTQEAIQTAVRGLMLKTAEQSLRDEFEAAQKRKDGPGGQRAYEAFSKSLYGGGNPQVWEDLTPELQRAWEAAADAS